MTRHFFVMGLDDHCRRYVESIRHAGRFAFHSLLDYDDVIQPDHYPFDALVAKAERTLRDFPEPVAGIVTHWDFPACTVLPFVARQFGLRAASPEAVLACEHKYWGRLEQREAIPEMTPRFCAVDPFAEDPLRMVDLDFPFWLKPVKSFSSYLAYRVEDEAGFRRAIDNIRPAIRRLGDAFNAALARIELPESLDGVDGNWCVAEEIMAGKQCGIEGYVLDGRCAIHGIFDGVKDSHNLSFTRWEHPSIWPQPVQQRMLQAAERLLSHLGYDNATFGMEFFWDEDSDRLMVLEVNPRISQSHSDQFIKVHGVSNHEVAVDVALGRTPDFPPEQGRYRTAAKFMLRRYRDSEVIGVPDEEAIRQIEAEFDDAAVHSLVHEGMHLSELGDQDSYSYELAHIWLGADDQDELLQKYHAVADRLHFRFGDGGAPEPFQFETVRY